MENQTIIVKKIKKGGHGHHGGAWKVAFADFATAMMAFFLLLWLIASTTQEEKAGLSEYFSPPVQGLSEGSGISQDVIDMGGGQRISQGDDSKEDARKPTDQEIQEAVESEKERLESLMEDLKKAIEQSQALKPFKDQLLLDITPEGLRIQIVDKENRPMFDSGSAELKGYTKEILHELARTINTVSNHISLTGHTDASRFVGRENYTNWELSADRANASRRELIIGGLAAEKIARVVGLASMVLFNKDEPRSPINRRIAIIVMNKAAEAALLNDGNNVVSADETEQLVEDKASERPRSLEGAIRGGVPTAGKLAAQPKPAIPVAKEEVSSAPPAKPKPRPKPEAKPKSKADAKVDLPPAREDEPSHINIPSPIAPINPINLPGQ